MLAACDALDGVKDGLLTDPRKCHFDPSTLLCRGGARDDCLTAPQVEAVKMAYAPAKKKTGELIYPGLVPGAKRVGRRWRAPARSLTALNVDMFRYVAHEDPNWDWRTFDLGPRYGARGSKGGYMNAMDPDLSAFKARGGNF